MDSQRKALFLMIAVGGSAVLGSYVLAFAVEPEIRSGLWGGIPDSLQGFYTVNMLLAAAGFFPATYWLGLKTPVDQFVDYTGLRFEALMLAYAAILMPSALWLPLTAIYIGEPTALLWIAIRIVLFLVGAGATCVAYMLIRRAAKGPSIVWGAVVAFFFFWLQTMILDAIVWPWFYHSA